MAGKGNACGRPSLIAKQASSALLSSTTWRTHTSIGRARIETWPRSVRAAGEVQYTAKQCCACLPCLARLSQCLLRPRTTERSPCSATRCGLLAMRWLSLQQSGCCLCSSEYHFPQTKCSSHLSQSTHASYVVHVPSAEVVSVTPLFTYPTQLVETSGMTFDESGTSFPPTYESEITVGALTAAGLSRSYAFTVVRDPGLPVDAPVSPVVTLVSLDAGVLVVTLSSTTNLRTKWPAAHQLRMRAQSHSWK